MVFPISDDNRDRRIVPIVNYVLIGVNVLVFLVLQGAGTNAAFTYSWATVPEEIRTGSDIAREVPVGTIPTTGEKVVIPLGRTPVSPYLTLLTSMFMHGGWLHLLGNMWFLWIFGDNIEDDLGHLRYLLFYLVCGVLASLAHVAGTFAFGDNEFIPSLGASGAIAGVLGGYMLLHPRRRVLVFMFRFLTYMPGWAAAGLWFALQLVLGLTALGGQTPGGVAYGAHIGGFVAGLVLVKLFAIGTGR